jgi:hypothetical protein
MALELFQVEILAEVTINITVILDATPCSLALVYKTTRRHNTGDVYV